MRLTKEWREFVELLISHHVDFLIAGAFAVAFHGHPRFTGDIDIFVRPTPQNGLAIAQALQAFGFGSLGIQAVDFTFPDRIVQLGFPPNRIDLITSITGLTFEQAWLSRVAGTLDDLPVFFIGLEDLIQNKESTGRPKDLGDADALRKRRPRL